jgi:hypothetical protein
MVSVLLEHQKEGNAWCSRQVAVGAGIFLGGVACLGGMLKCTKSFDSTYIPTQIGLAASFITPGIGAWWTYMCGYGTHRTNQSIKILEKENKTTLDWHAIREMGRGALRANTSSNNTGGRAEYVFTEDDSCELYNRDKNETFKWNMKDPKCVKDVILGKYNSSSWMFRKAKKEEL